MLILLAGIALFIGAHSLRETGLREPLRQRAGQAIYALSVGIIVILSIALISYGMSNASFIQVWAPPFHWRTISELLMLSSCFFFVSGFLPLSHSKQHFQHPALLGVAIWGIAHLLSNGDVASIILFSSITCWAFVKIVGLSRKRKDIKMGSKPALQWDVAALIIGFIFYSVLLIYHGHLFGYALIEVRF
ncbi:MAG: NnrU family protein [Pseudohongiellaceae bacterium]|nr:NnrU family protein [Pseudohongiellaceae bacterium]